MIKKIKAVLGRIFGIIWITLICSLMASPHDDMGGAEVNGVFCILFWVLLLYIIIRKHTLLAEIVSTVVMFVISIKKFGWGKLPYLGEALGMAIGYIVLAYMLYKLVFGDKLTDNSQRRKNKPIMKKEFQQEHPHEDSQRDYERMEPKLINGSDEYWAYRDAAEKIYWAFCESRTVDQRRYYKRRGEELKTRLFTDYGYNDESVKSICERFLDLRV